MNLFLLFWFREQIYTRKNQKNLESERTQSSRDRTRFLVRNLVRGLIWLTVIVGGYVLAKKYLDFDLEVLLGPIYDQPLIIYSIFLGSEVVFGIIPPEFFMFWSLRHGEVGLYVQNIVLLSAISYTAGVIGYYLGSFFNTTKLYRTIKRNFLGKVERHFNRFGGFLVIVAALTPLPFSGICMLVGAVKYPLRKFLLMALVRFARFGVYAYIIWQTNSI